MGSCLRNHRFFCEMCGIPRYTALTGKAVVLDVRIIALEELAWDYLVCALYSLWEESSELRKT